MPGDLLPQDVAVNGRAYAMPQRPVAVVCLDGCDPDYLAVGLAAGERLRSGGTAEPRLPFLVSTPPAAAWRTAHPHLRNYDIFDAALNGATA